MRDCCRLPVLIHSFSSSKPLQLRYNCKVKSTFHRQGRMNFQIGYPTDTGNDLSRPLHFPVQLQWVNGSSTAGFESSAQCSSFLYRLVKSTELDDWLFPPGKSR